jgi:hypothetical protein
VPNTPHLFFSNTYSLQFGSAIPEPLGPDWILLVDTKDVIALTATDGYLYGVKSGKLIRRVSGNWEEIGDAGNVVALAAMDGYLYGLTSNYYLQRRELIIGSSCNWQSIGQVLGAVALTALDGMLYCATADNRLLRLPVTELIASTSGEERPEILLLDLLQRSLVLASANRTDVKPIYSAICSLADASLSKPDIDRLFCESLDLCTVRCLDHLAGNPTP